MKRLYQLAIASAILTCSTVVNSTLIHAQRAIAASPDQPATPEIAQSACPAPKVPIPLACYAEDLIAGPNNTNQFPLMNQLYTLISQGQYEQVFALIQRLPNDAEKLQVFTLALKLLTASETTQPQAQLPLHMVAPIQQVAESFDQPEIKALTLLAMVDHFVETDQPQAATPLIAKIEQALQSPNLRSDRAEWQAKLAKVYAELGQVDRALQLVNSLPQDQKDGTLIEILQVAATAGQFEPALAIANRLSDPDLKAYALNTIADAYISVGKSTEALQLLAQVLPLAQRTKDEDSKVELLSSVALSYAWVGDDATALKILQTIHPEHQGRAAVDLASHYLEQKQYDRVMQMVQIMQAMNDAESVSDTLSSLAEAYIEAGRYDEALRLADSLQPTAPSSTSGSFSSDGLGMSGRLGILTSLANHFSEKGNKQKAIALFEIILPEATKVASSPELATIAISYYQATGDQAQAVKLINTARQKVEQQVRLEIQDFQLSAIAEAYAYVEQYDLAMQTIQTLKRSQALSSFGLLGVSDNPMLDYTLNSIALRLLYAGQIQPALQFVEAMQQSERKNETLTRMATEMAGDSQYDQALMLARKITDVTQRDRLVRLLECARGKARSVVTSLPQ